MRKLRNHLKIPNHLARSLRKLAVIGIAALLATGCAIPIPFGGSGLDENIVEFTYKGPARRVCLAGDFNHWSRNADCLRKQGEIWIIEIALGQGSYSYGFWVDGVNWVPDPQAVLYEDDGFGRKNSIIFIK